MNPVPTIAAEQLSAMPSILTVEATDLLTISGTFTSSDNCEGAILDSTRLLKTSGSGESVITF